MTALRITAAWSSSKEWHFTWNPFSSQCFSCRAVTCLSYHPPRISRKELSWKVSCTWYKEFKFFKLSDKLIHRLYTSTRYLLFIRFLDIFPMIFHLFLDFFVTLVFLFTSHFVSLYRCHIFVGKRDSAQVELDNIDEEDNDEVKWTIHNAHSTPHLSMVY